MNISQPSVAVVLGLVLSPSAFAQVNQPPPPSVVLASTGNVCPDGYVKLATMLGCRVAMAEAGLSGFRGTEDDASWPGGCYDCQGVASCLDGVWFNEHAVGAANGGAKPVCAVPGWEDGARVATLFVGDSDIDYWNSAKATANGYSSDDEYSNSVNIGVAGATCASGMERLDSALQLYNPERVVIVCGENGLYGNPPRVDLVFDNFKASIGKILASGARAVYLGTKPEPDTTGAHGTYRQYDARIREYVKELQTSSPASSPPLVMVDVYPSFEALGNPSNLYSSDELHLSSNGYAYWNTWTKTALADESGCSLWMNNACVEELPPPPPSVVLASAGNVCPDGYVKLATSQGCRAATAEAGLSGFHGTEDEVSWPGGCYDCQGVADCLDGVWFNEHAVGAANGGAQPICAVPGWEDRTQVATMLRGYAILDGL